MLTLVAALRPQDGLHGYRRHGSWSRPCKAGVLQQLGAKTNRCRELPLCNTASSALKAHSITSRSRSQL